MVVAKETLRANVFADIRTIVNAITYGTPTPTHIGNVPSNNKLTVASSYPLVIIDDPQIIDWDELTLANASTSDLTIEVKITVYHTGKEVPDRFQDLITDAFDNNKSTLQSGNLELGRPFVVNEDVGTFNRDAFRVHFHSVTYAFNFTYVRD